MTRIVTCESPEEYIWGEYLFLENEVTATALLKQKYTHLGIQQPERAAFKNVQAFTDYIKQARAIFSTLSINSLWVQPLLLYYGMMSLSKAFVLTRDAHYPANTAVLQHGLSTRRRKKVQFSFFRDDIRIQKDGLFGHVAKLLDTPLNPGESFKSEHLLSFIPEMQSTYQYFFDSPSLSRIILDQSDRDRGLRCILPENILDHFHVTAPSFVEKLNRELPSGLLHLEESPKKTDLVLLWKQTNRCPEADREEEFTHPWIYENIKGDCFMWTGKNRYGSAIPELLAHHMLVFALSMLCRYETTLWGEIVYSSVSEDAIIIQQLLSLVRRKFPHMILNLIKEEKILVFVR